MHAGRLSAVAAVVLCATVGAASAVAAPRGWESPVDAGVVSRFLLGADSYAAGSHRGVDFAASPGSPVRAACAGRVTFAGRVAGGAGVVTVACGSWRVTYLPLAALRVRQGSTATPGATIGVVGRDRGHAGLHMGVRDAGNPHGYVDPLPFLAAGTSEPVPPVGRFGGRGPRGKRPVDRFRPVAGRAKASAARVAVATPVAAPSGAPRVAPAPVWLGLFLLLAGGAGVCRRRTRSDAPTRLKAKEARAAAR